MLCCSRIDAQKVFLPGKDRPSKAYDRLQWSLIREMSLAYYAMYKAIINGEMTNAFIPGCEIRQRNPLSHYIFVFMHGEAFY